MLGGFGLCGIPAMDLLKDENQLNTISQNAKKMGKPNATNDIVNEIFKLIP